MSPEQRIRALEHELIDTRNAAACMMAEFIKGLVETEAGRAEVADDFFATANDSRTDPIEARLARLVAAAVRG